jgi:formylmethanofuran:tetrahydromethanopterin formyltransferase
MQFLTDTDFKGIIGVNTLTSLRGTADANLITAEQLAITELDSLRAKFDIPAELSKTGSNRNGLMIRLMIHITAYYLFNTVDDNDIPDRITENYKTQIQDIAKISSGTKESTLTPLLNEDASPKTSYRFGGDEPRDNDIF